MLQGTVLYRKANGNEVIYTQTRNNELMGAVRTKTGFIYPEKSVATIIARGYWDAVYEEFDKHLAGEHDQKTHGSWAGNFSDQDRIKAELAYSEQYEIEAPPSILVDTVADYVEYGYKTMNGFLRGKLGEFELSGENPQSLKRKISDLDRMIDEAPKVIGYNNLYRVVSNKVLESLNEGDVLIDKGFLSTTRANIIDKTERRTLEMLQDISSSKDSVMVILPTKQGGDRGLMPDLLFESIQSSHSPSQTQREREVILPRDTQLKFMGYEEIERPYFERPISSNYTEKITVAVFQRLNP